MRHLDIVYVPIRRYFSVPIPHDMFYDSTDGSTSNLELRLLDGNMKSAHAEKRAWFFLDRGTLSLYGIVVNKTVAKRPHQFILMARNSFGLSAHDPFIVIVNSSTTTANRTHFVEAVFDMDYVSFVDDTKSVMEVVSRIATFFGGESQQLDIAVHEGSVVLRFTNRSASRCEDTASIRKRILFANGTARAEFVNALAPEFPLVNLTFRLQGQCLTSPSPAKDDSTLIIAILVPVLVILLILAIVLICCIYVRREKRVTGKVFLEDMNGTNSVYKHDRKPIILPDDYELGAVRVSRLGSRAPVAFDNDGISLDAGDPALLTPRPRPSAPHYAQRRRLREDEITPSPPPSYSSQAPQILPSYRTPPPYIHKV